MTTYDIIIIGGGPAGLTAAIYAGRANKKVLVLEKGTFGGQITSSPRVENIPGFIQITGNEFAEKLIEQAMSLEADVECCEVLKVIDGEIKTVVTDEGDFFCKTIIIASGTKHRLLGLDNEENLIGNGISFCAVCDGAFYDGKTVAVIGGGNSAMQEAILLSENCKKVYVIQNLDFFTGEKKLADQLVSKDNIEIIMGTVVENLLGETKLNGITIKSSDGECRDIMLDGLFVAIGLLPQNDIFSDIITLDERGYIAADECCQTNAKGIFAAGDCRTKQVRQVTTAAADGAVAALAACEYVR